MKFRRYFDFSSSYTNSCDATSEALVARLEALEGRMHRMQDVLAHSFVQQLLVSPRHQELGRLGRFDAQQCSQSGEDGILAEIFRRIGTTNRFAVEFGAGDGTGNNTLWPLLQDWRALWIEYNEAAAQRAASRLSPLIPHQLTICTAQVTAENIEALFRQNAVPTEFDLLSIDIDGNDFWVWQALQSFHPRVVVMEYNALYAPPVCWVRPYNASARWDGTSFFGASLQALEELGAEKGYRLVGCTLSGINAFWVREDLCDNDDGQSRFAAPFTAANHYEPARYFLARPLPYPVHLVAEKARQSTLHPAQP
jgi:hypothetical protein